MCVMVRAEAIKMAKQFLEWPGGLAQDELEQLAQAFAEFICESNGLVVKNVRKEICEHN